LAVVDEKLGSELEAVIVELGKKGGYAVQGEHYKRVPRGFDKEHPRADLLRYNTLYSTSPRIDPSKMSSPEITEITIGHFEKMAPLQRWLVKVKSGVDVPRGSG
jgi:uncharacterized protein (DUF2461 family)